MLKIRLTRVGHKNLALYRLVVTERTKPTNSGYFEVLGSYNPHTKKANLKADRIKEWLDKGAIPSFRVAMILGKEGLYDFKPKKFTPRKNKKQAKEDAKNEGQAAPKAEAPKTETKPAAKTEEKKEEPKKEASAPAK